MFKKKITIPLSVITILHVVGLIGLQSTYHSFFLSLTPLNLLISTFCLFSKQVEFSKPFFLFAFLIFSAGYVVEVLGIHTKIVFGNYEYGKTLGPAFFDVPILMGLNWLNLIYSVGIVFNRFQVPNYLKSVLGACCLAVLDFFLEPVAMKFDFWSWENNIVPFQNYLAWFICSFLFLNLFYLFPFKKENRLAFLYLIIQLLFFFSLSCF